MTRHTAETAVTEALRLRQRMGYSLETPISAVDLAAKLGLQVRFKALPSLEGLYVPGSPALIVLGSHRPSGRRNYTCAHEVGHHVFSDGYSIDAFTQSEKQATMQSREEYLANRFAAALLMPKLAVCAAFVRRNWRPETPSPTQALVVATHLRVGYSTLVRYMHKTLGLLGNAEAKRLLKLTPQQIRYRILGTSISGSAFLVEKHLTIDPIDAETGDVIVPPPETARKGDCLKPATIGAGRPVLLATQPGIAKLRFPDASPPLTVRVSRRGFEGLSIYRYLEETDDGT